MKNWTSILLVLLIFSLSSCEYFFDEVLDDMLYNARCEVVHQGELDIMEPGRALMKVKVKNKGSLDACCVEVFAELMLGNRVIESQREYIDYLCSGSSETVTIAFRSIVYGSEYDGVDVSLSWTEVEREDWDEDDDNW